jgi:hypothetical protein
MQGTLRKEKKLGPKNKIEKFQRVIKSLKKKPAFLAGSLINSDSYYD